MFPVSNNWATCHCLSTLSSIYLFLLHITPPNFHLVTIAAHIRLSVSSSGVTMLESYTLQNVDKIKYLGVTITEDLRWNTRDFLPFSRAKLKIENGHLFFTIPSLFSQLRKVKKKIYINIYIYIYILFF